MEVLVAITVGIVFGSGLYLVMQRNMLRFVFGLILLSGSVNVSIFVAGRLTRGAAPLVPADASVPQTEIANALPQALILTAIVIGFGLTVFALVLLLRTYERLGTVRTDEMIPRLHDPHPVSSGAAQTGDLPFLGDEDVRPEGSP
ncbi:MAG: NADH-quinone oxidoreductase subunit K [Trueperaceae bacterium]